MLLRSSTALIPALALTACFEIAPPPPVPIGSALEGQLLVQGAFSASDKSARTRAAVARLQLGGVVNANDMGPDLDPVRPTGRRLTPPDFPKHKLEWLPSQILVLTEARTAVVRELDDKLAAAAGAELVLRTERCVASTLCRVRVEDTGGKPIDEERTFALARSLHEARLPGVRVVSINSLKYLQRLPNDEHFDLQWHHSFSRLPGAWDITTGSDSVIVGVIDGGMNLTHPDVIGRLNAGFDFITEPSIAGDGNGFDTDPTDPGDNAFGNGNHSWHGTHVGGIIGASTNNNQGIAGVTWASRIVPVRALGLGQAGSDFDILNGLLWVVGETDFGGAAIAPITTKAKVVNMSLGGPSDPQSQQLWEDIVTLITITEATRFGNPILVTAAGNEGIDAATITPANISGLITVGATRLDGRRASYSNFGPAIDVMAPGGQLNFDQDADGFGDGVLSLFDNAYEYEQGTSFAAPEVTGIIALMLAVDPTLDMARTQQIIRQAADPAGICSEGCGTGHADALQALIQSGGIVQDRPQLAVDANRLVYQPTEVTRQVRVINIGSAPLDWRAVINGREDLWVIEPTGGTLPTGAESTTTVTLTRGTQGSASATLLFEGLNEAADQQVFIELSFNDLAAPPQANLVVAEVSAFPVGPGGTLGDLAGVTTTRRDSNFTWRIEGLDPGNYRIFAVGDDDNDGVFNPQTDSFGAYPVASNPTDLVVGDNQIVRGVNFGLQQGFAIGGGGVGAGCINNLDCGFAPDAECVDAFPGGYCSRVCDDGFCGAGASCELLDCDGAPCNVCLERCIDTTQCRQGDGYVCDVFGTCTPDGF